jgi:2,3-bisphosphoglycerate-dependent phosphoglycerate mutase
VTRFVRHGESTWNAAGVIQGQRNEATLTASGRRQIRCLGHELIAARAEIECIVSSDLDRARESASILARQLLVPVVLDRRLRERDFGSLEGTSRAELPDGFDGIVDGVIVDPDVRPGGGETLGDVLARMAAFIEEGPPAGATWRDTVVVAHGGPIRMAAAWASGRPLCGLEWSDVPNGALVAVPLSGSVLAEVPGLAGSRSRVAV